MIIPSLFAPDLSQTIHFYTDLLGFEKTGAWPETGELRWAELTLKEAGAKIWLFSEAIKNKPAPMLSGVIYILTNELSAIEAKLSGKVDFKWGPEEQDYGLREIGIEDPNGYILAFAQKT